MKSQWMTIYEHLRTGETLTPKDARKMFGCDRLAARINDIRRAMDRGDIPAATIFAPLVERDGHRVAEYSMVRETQKKQVRQHNTMCACGLSYWSVNGLCNKCNATRGQNECN